MLAPSPVILRVTRPARVRRIVTVWRKTRAWGAHASVHALATIGLVRGCTDAEVAALAALDAQGDAK